ncbi:hypothetical protein GCM10008956_37160 [Deinococcus arenae]|uniref:Uncharacterized protein n=1 Tax=Deinococcus arenae TaxID=1452751 RepID=A0A8H9GX50_9DEIO|nr:hypothetical protein [Deinococcus arenae]GGM58123.1 hypothetical protein GCM10008956_37160 [Deinococcus arenae]
MTSTAQEDLLSAQARLVNAQADALELQLKEASDPKPPQPVKDLKDLKDALPIVPAPTVATGVTFADSYLIGTSYVYEMLPQAVQELKSAIYSAEYTAQKGQDFKLIYIDDDLSLLAAKYHSLWFRIQTAYSLYESLSSPPANPGSKSFAPAAIALGGGVLALQAVGSTLNAVAGIAQVFAVKKSVKSSEVTLEKRTFDDLLRAELERDGRNSAIQVPVISWDFEVAAEMPTARLHNAVLRLSELANRDTMRTAEGKELRASYLSELTSIIKEFQEFGFKNSMIIENLAEILKDDVYRLVYADLVHASVSVATKDSAWKHNTEVSLHPAIVMSFTMLDKEGRVIQSGVKVTRKRIEHWV